MRIKMAMRELKQLMEEDPDHYTEVEAEEVDVVRPPPSGPVEMEVEEEDPVANRARAIQSAARKAHVLDDVPIAIKKNKTQAAPAERVHQPFLTKRAISAKGKEKQLEKELPWHLIPPEPCP